MKHRFVQLLILVTAVFFILNLGRSIYGLWQKGDIVAESEQIRDELREKNLQLKEEQMRVETPEFIEEQARNKLNLTREGEVVVVLPELPISPIPQAQTELSEEPNWQKWWKLFF